LADGSFDIVVVGGGGTGLMSAYAAARHGRSVVLLEKAAAIGGTTGLSVGTICATNRGVTTSIAPDTFLARYMPACHTTCPHRRAAPMAGTRCRASRISA